MQERNEEEKKAYVDGYNACFFAFRDSIKRAKSIEDAIHNMEVTKAAVNLVISHDGHKIDGFMEFIVNQMNPNEYQEYYNMYYGTTDEKGC